MKRMLDAEGEDWKEVEKWIRNFYDITDETVESFLIRKKFKDDSAVGVKNRLMLALAWLKPRITEQTQSMFDEMSSLITEFDFGPFLFHLNLAPAQNFGSFKTDAERDAEARILEHKFQNLFDHTATLHKLQPALAAQKKYQGEQSARASKPRKITEEERRRIARQYWQAQADGERYGTTKRLAAQYNVSETTIFNVAKKYPESIDK